MSDHLLGRGNFQVQTVLYKNSQKRSQVNVNIEKKPSENKGHLFHLVKQGQGHFDHFKNVSWTSQTIFHVENDFVIIHSSSTKIEDSSGRILATYEKSYDYIIRQATWRKTDGAGNIIDEWEFPFEGKICDDESLMIFLPPFLRNPHEVSPSSFYRLTNEPRLHKTRLTGEGADNLSLPWGNVPAWKIKLTVEEGIFNNILARLVPPTFVWFAQAPPHDWLQYQGMESTSWSPYVLSFVQIPPARKDEMGSLFNH